MNNAAESLESLRQSVEGSVLARGEDGFREAFAGYNTASPTDPDYVVSASSDADVQAAVRFASAHGLPVYMQATGHGSYAPITSGVLVRTQGLNDLDIDPEARIATIGAGLPWSKVVGAAGEHGLAAITGSSPSVSAVGLALGGGLGPLSRTFGFTADWVRGFTVVTADGEITTADADQNPDLFWALRGGKGGLGVVTQMKLELVPLPTLYGGGLFFDTEYIEPVFRAWVDWTATVPETVTSSVALVRFPPTDDVPEPIRGKFALHLRFAFVGAQDLDPAGRAAEGEKYLAPLRAIAPTIWDLVGELPASSVGTIHNDPPGPMPIWERGMLLEQIDQDYVTALLEKVGAATDVPLIAVETRHIGGATSRPGPTDNAVGGRSGKFTLVLIGVPVQELFAEVLPGVGQSIVDSIERYICSETNYNFAGYPSTADHFASAWPKETHLRLQEVRRNYDPTGMFAFGPPSLVVSPS